MRTLLIDADILAVSTAAACEKEVCFDPEEDIWQLYCDVSEVKKSILKAIDRLKEQLNADAAVLCLSKGLTFRHHLSPSYKSGRGRKPVGTNEVKRWMHEDLGAKLIHGIEADDIMGILATNPRIIKGEKVIVSQDKDMKTIPGLLYQGGEVLEISPAYATHNWLMQTLTGDTTDGYPGCPTMGPVKAAKVIESTDKDGMPYTFEELWHRVVKAFEKAGKTADDALLQARLARILHNEDFDFTKKEPILWTPSTTR